MNSLEGKEKKEIGRRIKMEFKGEQIIKKELVQKLGNGVFGSISCEIMKYYKWSEILQRSSDVKFISFVDTYDNHNQHTLRCAEKIGTDLDNVKDWTINRYPEFEGVL